MQLIYEYKYYKKKNTKFDSIISIALSNVILNNQYFIRSKNSKMYE